MPLLQREIILDGVRLQTLQRDPVAGPPQPAILLLHGVAASAWTLQALIAELPPNHRIIALNIPGAELPGSPTLSDLSLLGLARQVRNVAQKLGLETPIILGHSHGGAIALQLAASFPEAISGLILLCPAHPFLLRERRLVVFYNSWAGHLLAHTIRLLSEPLQGIGFNRLLGPKGRKAGIDFKPYREPFKSRDNVTQILRLLKTWTADMDALGTQLQQQKIQTPTLFLWGDHDSVVPIETAPALQRHIQNWQQVTLLGVGHLPNDEATAECGRAIRSWLEQSAGETS